LKKDNHGDEKYVRKGIFSVVIFLDIFADLNVTSKNISIFTNNFLKGGHDHNA